MGSWSFRCPGGRFARRGACRRHGGTAARRHGGTAAPNPILFDLLDAMDGGAPDALLLFLLTTNRADLLEPALAARPGRVDIALEIALPDAAARQRLLALYGQEVTLALTDDDIVAAVERTEGVTASFLKELIRRSVLESLAEAGTLTSVTGAHLSRALEDLLGATREAAVTLGLGPGHVDPRDIELATRVDAFSFAMEARRATDGPEGGDSTVRPFEDEERA